MARRYAVPAAGLGAACEESSARQLELVAAPTHNHVDMWAGCDSMTAYALFASSSLRILLVSCGFARPLVSFMIWPTRKVRAFSFPAK
jgi:hypothetical protein